MTSTSDPCISTWLWYVSSFLSLWCVLMLQFWLKYLMTHSTHPFLHESSVQSLETETSPKSVLQMNYLWVIPTVMECSASTILLLTQILSNALRHCWSSKKVDPQWMCLLQVSDSSGIEYILWSWPSHLGSILGFKLFCVLSGSARLEGAIPRTKMSVNLKNALECVVCTC